MTMVAMLGVTVGLHSGCQTIDATGMGVINHVVFFKLKNPDDSAELIADCDAHLATIPGVVSYFCGTHLDTGRGDRIDSSYDVGFYIGFMAEADYASYVDHPQHGAMLAKWSQRWEWIRVIDVQDTTP